MFSQIPDTGSHVRILHFAAVHGTNSINQSAILRGAPVVQFN
jgi:hypothetical protein